MASNDDPPTPEAPPLTTESSGSAPRPQTATTTATTATTATTTTTKATPNDDVRDAAADATPKSLYERLTTDKRVPSFVRRGVLRGTTALQEIADTAGRGHKWLHTTWPAGAKTPVEFVQLVSLRINELILRRYMRAIPEQNRLFILTAIIGGVCGAAAVAFHLAIGGLEHLLIDRALSAHGWWQVPAIVILPVVGALICGLLLHYVVPNARGSGIPQVKVAYAIKGGRVRLRDAIGKFFISALQIGSGSSLGREGPTVYICAGIATSLGRLFALSPQNTRRLVPVGSAAGIAAAFNAPIAAVTFTTEELVGGLDETVLSGVVVAAAVAAVIERTVLGEHAVFAFGGGYGLTHTSSLLVYALLGVAAAGVSHLFVRALLQVRKEFKASRIPPWARPAVGAFVTGAFAAVTITFLRTGGVTGGGYATLSQALAGNVPALTMFALCAIKTIATVFSYSSGGAGGIFAPALFVGGMLGGAFSLVDSVGLGHVDTQAGAFALVGMGAVFAGVIRAPITSFLIIFEMTDGYGLILPLMIANSTSYVLARRWQKKPIYEALLEQDGINLPHHTSAASALSALQVQNHMMPREKLRTLMATTTVRTALEGMAGVQISTFPIMDAGKHDLGGPPSMIPALTPGPAANSLRFVGLLSEAKLRRLLAEGHGDTAVGGHVRPREYLSPDQPMLDAVVRMNKLGVRQMAVVDTEENPPRLVGMFAMSDVMRAHASAAGESLAPMQVPSAVDPGFNTGEVSLTSIPPLPAVSLAPPLTSSTAGAGTAATTASTTAPPDTPVDGSSVLAPPRNNDD